MISNKKIIKKLLKTTRCEDGVNSGCECLFLNFGHIGLKLYMSKCVRDNCFYSQEAAYARDLAPKASNPMYMKIGNVDIYGYYTEIAEVMVEVKKSDKRLKMHEEYDIFMENIKEVVSPGCFNDLSDWNIGFIGNRHVCIDFGNGGRDYLESRDWNHVLDEIKDACKVLN